MARRKKAGHWYGTELADLSDEIVRYSKAEREATKFIVPACPCEGDLFTLRSDDSEGAAERTCCRCGVATLMGDCAEYVAGANLEGHECLCGCEKFSLTIGVGLYEASNDVAWVYIGCWCPQCKLIGVFSDWSAEAGDADAFLAKC